MDNIKKLYFLVSLDILLLLIDKCKQNAECKYKETLTNLLSIKDFNLRKIDKKKDALYIIVKAMFENRIKEEEIWDNVFYLVRKFRSTQDPYEYRYEIVKTLLKEVFANDIKDDYIWYKLLDLVDNIKASSITNRERLWAVIAVFEKLLEYKKDNTELLKRSIDIAKGIKDGDSKLKAVDYISRMLIDKKIYDDAVWDKLSELPKYTPSKFYRSVMITDLANAFIKIGKKNEARKLLKKSLNIAEKIEDDFSYRSIAFSEIADVLISLGDIEKAKEIINKAIVAEEKENSAFDKALALKILITTLARLKDRERVNKMTDKLKSVIDSVEDEEEKYEIISCMNISDMEFMQLP